MRRLFALLAIAGLAGLAGCAAHGVLLAASTSALPRGHGRRRVVDDEVVLVPGYRLHRNGTLPLVARWRCRIAARSTDVRRARFLFSGGVVRGHRSEAAAMADHAVRRLGIPLDRIRLEERSTTSWGNVAECVPLLTGAPAIRVASQPFHALLIRRYLAIQAPRLVPLLRPARDAVLTESLLLGPWQLAHECRRRSRRRCSAHGSSWRDR